MTIFTIKERFDSSTRGRLVKKQLKSHAKKGKTFKWTDSRPNLTQKDFISVADLRIDDKTQRCPFSKARFPKLAQIVANPCEKRFGRIIVAKRLWQNAQNPPLVVVEGQARVLSAHCMGVKKVPCDIIVFDNAKDEALFFLQQGKDVHTIKNWEKHHVTLGDPSFSGYTKAIDIQKVVDKTQIEYQPAKINKVDATAAYSGIKDSLTKFEPNAAGKRTCQFTIELVELMIKFASSPHTLVLRSDLFYPFTEFVMSYKKYNNGLKKLEEKLELLKSKNGGNLTLEDIANAMSLGIAKNANDKRACYKHIKSGRIKFGHFLSSTSNSKQVTLYKHGGHMSINLGYACINSALQEQKISSNRGMIKRTFKAKGVPYASELALINVTALKKIIEWNIANDISVYRMTSNLFPWMSEYDIFDLPDIDAIVDTMSSAGKIAMDAGQRLSFHPGPFNCLASPNDATVAKTIAELDAHSLQMDLMGLPMSPQAKINIHVGGAYGEHDNAMARFCKNYAKLAPSTQARLTVENDDKASMFSTKMLYHGVSKSTGIPIVFDSHHHELGPQDASYKEAFYLARDTWQKRGVKQQCHHSNSKRNYEDSSVRANAHSDWYYTPFENFGEAVDVVLECKKKEQALLKYRNDFSQTI